MAMWSAKNVEHILGKAIVALNVGTTRLMISMGNTIVPPNMSEGDKIY